MIRPSTRDDAPAIARFESWSIEQLVTTLTSARAAAWVAESDGVVAHILTSIAADEAEVLLLAVHPAARRQGIANALLAEAEAHWTARGVTAAFLEVRADNIAAIALYRSRGWRQTGRRAGYYRDGVDALAMSWSP